MKRFFPLFLYCESSEAPNSLYVFTKVLEEWKPKHKRLQGGNKVAGALINHGDNLYTVLWPITTSLTGISFGPPLTSHQIYRVISVNSSIKWAVGCLKRVLSGATKEMFQEINDIELWGNKCYTFTWVQLRLCRDSSLHYKAAKTHYPAGSSDKIHAHHWLEMHFQNVFILCNCKIGSLTQCTAAADVVLWQSDPSLSPQKLVRLCWLHLWMWAGRRVPTWLTGQKIRTESFTQLHLNKYFSKICCNMQPLTHLP